MESLINMVLLTLLAATTIAMVGQRSLLGVVILASVYSFQMASVMIVLDAVDVAMTEASVGAAISTVLLLGALHLTKTREEAPRHGNLLPLLLCAAVAAMLIWGTMVLPPFGTPDAVIHQHVAPRYINDGVRETGSPNIVTAVLADYRGFDTLGETTVIFIAGIGVMLLLLGGLRRRDRAADSAAEDQR